MKVKSESEVAQLFPTLHEPMNCSLSASSVHGILQTRVLEWVAIAFSIALTRQTFIGKIINVSVFNMLSRLAITFLPRSKHHLISWLQSPSVVILEPPKIKSFTISIISLSICHEVMEPDAMSLAFEC